MALNDPILLSGTAAKRATPTSYIAPSDTLLSGQLLDASIARPGIPAWVVPLAVTVGKVYSYGGKLYETIQAHTTQSDWTPNVARSLFKPFRPPDVISNWLQPVAAFDAYPLGWKVIHNGFTWQSAVNANVWQPGAVGSEALWTNLTPPPAPANWAVGVDYKVGDNVTYVPNGLKYQCLQAHKSIATWTPPVVPALWKVVAG